MKKEQIKQCQKESKSLINFMFLSMIFSTIGIIGYLLEGYKIYLILIIFSAISIIMIGINKRYWDLKEVILSK